MRTYSEQPIDIVEPDVLTCIGNLIKESLEARLPDCEINRWFITSVYFANMIDSIIHEIKSRRVSI